MHMPIISIREIPLSDKSKRRFWLVLRQLELARIMQEIRIRVDWGPEKMP